MDDRVKIEKKPKRTKKKIVLSVFLVFLVAIALAILYFFVFRDSQSVHDKKNASIAEASRLANNGETKKALDEYDKIINAIDNLQDKSNYVIEKALVYENDGQLDKALSSAQEAESYYQSEMTAGTIARLFEKKGDNTNAIKYLNKVIILLDKDSPIYNDEKESLDIKIAELTKIMNEQP